jgi:hypothetical protein
MASANLSLNITAVLATGTKSHVPPGLNFGSTPGSFTLVNIPNGTATLTPPAGTNTIVVVMPPTAAAITIKNSAGDTGIPLVLSSTDTRWFVMPIGTALIVTSNAIVNGVEVLFL